MILDELAKVLETAGLGVFGTTIFVFRMPSEIPIGISLLDRTGNGMECDGYIDGLRRGNVQLVVRHNNYTDGMTMARDAVTAFAGIDRSVLNNAVEIKQLRPKHEPIAFPISVDGDVFEFSVNFDVIFSTLI